ncbi:MAG: alpha/beta fold hydrolase [Pseudomonadota bacterium]
MSIKITLIRSAFYAWSRIMPATAGEWLVGKFFVPEVWKKPFDPPSGKRVDLADGGVLWQDTDRDRSALLLHGWSGHRSQLGDIEKLLRRLGFSVHLLDMPGHGASKHQRSNPVRFAQAINEAINVTGRVDLVIAHSMGAVGLMYSTHAIRRELDKLAKQLIFISAPTGVEPALNLVTEQAAFGRKATSFFLEEVDAEVGVKRSDFDFLKRAEAANIPLLIIHDKDDRLIPISHANDIASAWPGASVMQTDGFGHYRTLQAKVTLQAIEDLVVQVS